MFCSNESSHRRPKAFCGRLFTHSPADPLTYSALVRKALRRGWYAAAKRNELAGAAGPGHRDNCRFSEQAAERGFFPRFFSRNRNQPGGRGLLVYYPYRHLIGYYRRKGFGRSISRQGNHVQSDRAYAGHRFEFFDRKKSLPGGFRDIQVFAHKE